MKLLRRIGSFIKRRKIISAVIGIIVLLVVWNMVSHDPKNGYELTTPVRESVVEYVSETGNILSSNAAPVYSTTDGIVQEVPVENGTAVSAGDVLAVIKSTATDQEKSAARANFLAAQAALAAAQSTEYSLQASMFSAWDSYRAKYEDDEYEDAGDEDRNEPDFQVPQKEWFAAESAYKNQQNVVAQRQAELNAQRLAYQATQDSTLTAPVDGVVQNLSVGAGQNVAALSPVSTAVPVPVLLITTGAKPSLMVEINESDYAKVAQGQPVSIELDALDNTLFDGTVARVDAVGTNTQGVVTYRVYITIDSDSADIRPGMTATAEIEVDRKDDVLTVPVSAVKPYQGGRAVRVVGESGEVEYVPVETGVRGDTSIEIISGIDENTQIITALKNEQIQRNSSFFGG